jgi:hypothetical protein
MRVGKIIFLINCSDDKFLVKYYLWSGCRTYFLCPHFNIVVVDRAEKKPQLNSNKSNGNNQTAKVYGHLSNSV